MSVSTTANSTLGIAYSDAGLSPAGDTLVVRTGYGVTWLPTTLDDWLALPEHETVICPECNHTGVMIHGDVCRCVRCGHGWRWPGMGLD